MTDGPPRGRARRRFLRTCGALALGTALGGCVVSTEPYTETVDRSFDPGGADSLAVVTGDGDVTLSAGDGDAVSGTVRKESRSGKDALDEVTVEATTTDGRLRIGPSVPDRDLNVAVHLDLSIPADLAVAEAATTNGDVSVTGVAGDATCRSENGDVRVEGVDGYVTLESTNGDVTARGTTGVDGAETSNGDVAADVAALRGDAGLTSTNGDVTAAVPDDLGATVSLRTDNGDASAAGVDLTTDRSAETAIEGRLGSDPEHALSLRSTNGDVTLEPL